MGPRAGIPEEKSEGWPCPGRWDPSGQGVLLVCIGKATKLAEDCAPNRQCARNIRRLFSFEYPRLLDLEKAIDHTLSSDPRSTRNNSGIYCRVFWCEQEKIAPLFSAKSLTGSGHYELARKQ
jgi:tRNA pseudouridine55 synthase